MTRQGAASASLIFRGRMKHSKRFLTRDFRLTRFSTIRMLCLKSNLWISKGDLSGEGVSTPIIFAFFLIISFASFLLMTGQSET